MQDRIFGDREKALEDGYFRDRDAKLLEKLRQRAQLDEIAVALGEKLQVDNPDLLARAKELGITLETAPALFLAPLVQVAWAVGKVSKKESHAVLRAAQRRGVEPGTPAYAQMEEWLHHAPPPALFEVAAEVLKAGYAVLPAPEREQRIKEMVASCREVVGASTGLARIINLAAGVSPVEDQTLDDIERSVRGRE